MKRLDPAFWDDSAVRAAAAAWDFGTVVRLFRRHTGLSQTAVARLVSIDQAEVSRLERGQKKIRDRRQLAQWSEALGMPVDLLGPLPNAASHPTTTAHSGASPVLQDGPGQLLLPAGRNLPPSLLPTLTSPAASFRGNLLWLSPSSDLEAWSSMPLRALLAATRIIDGARRYFVMDAREGSPSPEGRTHAIPAAFELDDLTYGILWAVAGFDSALLGDDAALHEVFLQAPEKLLGGSGSAITSGSLTDGSHMLIGSQVCAWFILEQRDALGGDPVFWTREQRGEEAATWLFFEHKHRYLKHMAPQRPQSGAGRGFCVPRQEVVASPTYERVLLFLAIALMESYGITTWLTEEPELQETDGFVLVPGRRVAIATWVRAAPVPRTSLTASAQMLRNFTDVTGHARAHTVTAGATPGQRLVATADYLGLDRPWLARRCRQLAAEGTTTLARPRSRHLSLDALDIACSYVAGQFALEAGTRAGATR
ncbi:helix-turn-helix domain-containing protein [Streptomyces sp. CBMA152]|uniref:helix-turn-helix domain-containing protein n=1 Tax=Streptomyces sp. CBMA152 TaxID=1896312 RepID=UPI0016612998|nr:helix-turn-helix transcriptional regulator [Streptomyces sp. CBMA152]